MQFRQISRKKNNKNIYLVKFQKTLQSFCFVGFFYYYIFLPLSVRVFFLGAIAEWKNACAELACPELVEGSKHIENGLRERNAQPGIDINLKSAIAKRKFT